MLRYILDRRLVVCAVMSASIHACTVGSDDLSMRDVEGEVEPDDDAQDELPEDFEPVEEPAEVPDAGVEASIPPKASSTTLIPIVVSLIPMTAGNRTGQKLGGQALYVTVHETNNPRSNAFGERAFFHGGGGDAKVAVHFAVDDVRAVQLLPLDEVGKHSGSVEGNRTSSAIETCVATSMNFAKVRRNLAQLIARIAANDPSLDWGGGSTRGRFSLERLRMHNDWAPANPCPRHIRSEGFWPTLLDWVDEASQQLPW